MKTNKRSNRFLARRLCRPTIRHVRYHAQLTRRLSTACLVAIGLFDLSPRFCAGPRVAEDPVQLAAPFRSWGFVLAKLPFWPSILIIEYARKSTLNRRAGNLIAFAAYHLYFRNYAHQG